MIIQSDFKPSSPLSNRHIQTILPFFLTTGNNIPYSEQRLELPDGDFVDIFWCDNLLPQIPGASATADNKPIVIILHGMGGCFSSHYIPGMVRSLLKLGFRVAFLHARGCSGEMNRLPVTFHAADTSELHTLVNLLVQQNKDTRLFAVGFSLGGSILLKWLAETNNSQLLTAAVALSVPFDLSATADTINHGFSRVYQKYLLRRLKTLAIEKLYKHPAPLNARQIKAIKTLREYDNLMTAPINGFGNVDNYYATASCYQYLSDIETPTLILNAVDDPFVPSTSIPVIDALSGKITLELSDYGGHVGFIQNIKNSIERYSEIRTRDFLQPFSPLIM